MKDKSSMQKSSNFKKIIFIFKYIFLGLIFWSFYYAVYSISRKSAVNKIIAMAGIIIFYIIISSIKPDRINNKEFGKHSNIIGWLISMFVIVCLGLVFGIGF